MFYAKKLRRKVQLFYHVDGSLESPPQLHALEAWLQTARIEKSLSIVVVLHHQDFFPLFLLKLFLCVSVCVASQVVVVEVVNTVAMVGVMQQYQWMTEWGKVHTLCDTLTPSHSHSVLQKSHLYTTNGREGKASPVRARHLTQNVQLSAPFLHSRLYSANSGRKSRKNNQNFSWKLFGDFSPFSYHRSHFTSYFQLKLQLIVNIQIFLIAFCEFKFSETYNSSPITRYFLRSVLSPMNISCSRSSTLDIRQLFFQLETSCTIDKFFERFKSTINWNNTSVQHPHLFPHPEISGKQLSHLLVNIWKFKEISFL